MALAARKRYAPIYVSHGGPNLITETDLPQHRYLKALGPSIGRPRAIVIFSGHWEADPIEVSLTNNLIYDFYGFPKSMYKLLYAPPEAPTLTKRIVELLSAKSIDSRIVSRGLDHGAWIPLKIMYPEADIPVVQISLKTGLDPADHLKIGEALRPLLEDEVLIVGSGSSSHNLRLVWGATDEDAKNIAQFETWLKETGELVDLEERSKRLIEWKKAPSARVAHPREEHLLPFHIVAGMGRLGKQTYSTLLTPSMPQSFYTFELPEQTAPAAASV